MDARRMIFIIALLQFSTAWLLEARDPLDPYGNITVKWDIISWTHDGYIAVVTISNFHQYRHIQAPGWVLGWNWSGKEFIWSMLGGRATERGDCTIHEGKIPHCCKGDPTIMDLPPGAPSNKQIANCCRGGVISSLGQDPTKSISRFRLRVGGAGNTDETVRMPNSFHLEAPGGSYACDPPIHVKSTRLLPKDGRKQAFVTWDIVCQRLELLLAKPVCCVSFASYYIQTSVPCPICSCGCQNTSEPGSCLDSNLQLVQYTSHTCPVQIHWNLKSNFKDFWLVQISIRNYNFNANYTDWNLVVQNVYINSLTRMQKFKVKNVASYKDTNSAVMLWGMKQFKDLIAQGNIQSDLLIQKDRSNFSSERGGGVPEKIYFNGDLCAMATLPLEVYPYLTEDNLHRHVFVVGLVTIIVVTLILLVSIVKYALGLKYALRPRFRWSR